MKIIFFLLLLSLTSSLFSCKKSEDPVPAGESYYDGKDMLLFCQTKTVTHDSVDSLVTCTDFDNSLVGNEYILYLSKEELNAYYDSFPPNTIHLSGPHKSVSFINDTLADYIDGDIIYQTTYQIIGNEVILYNGDEAFKNYYFSPDCEEKLIMNSSNWYLNK